MSQPFHVQSVSSFSMDQDSNLDELHDAEKPESKSRQMRIVAAVLCCVLGIGLGVGVYGITNHFHHANSTSAVDAYVLPKDRVQVTQVNSTFIGGIFTVNSRVGQLRFEFMSDKTAQKIRFAATNPEMLINVVQFKGFEVDVYPTRLFFMLCPVGGGMNAVVEITNTTHLNSTGRVNMQEFADSVIASYFVELSVKLGVWGYTGKNNSAAAAIHTMAKVFVKGSVFPVSSLSNETVARANQVVAATTKLGHIPGSIQEILDNSGGKDGGNRRRLVLVCSCSISNTCGNPCYGMCGKDCDCWAWFCGTCGCYPECQQHDWYCSCDSFWGFWCLNVFWVGCGCANW